MKLTGQVALVTGAPGGIGSAICRALASQGASLILHYRSREAECRALQEELESNKVTDEQAFVSIRADLLSDEQTRAMVSEAITHFSRLDILVNNAGWSRHVPPNQLNDLDEQLFELTVGLKIQAPIYLARACREQLAASGNGQIINITSVAGIAARGSSIVYAAANAALSSLTQSLARTLAPEIRVNAIAPGFVETGFVWPKDGKVKAYVAQQNHIGRTVEAEEVAEVVRFLACDAPAITGEEIAIDGGIGRLGKK